MAALLSPVLGMSMAYIGMCRPTNEDGCLCDACMYE